MGSISFGSLVVGVLAYTASVKLTDRTIGEIAEKKLFSTNISLRDAITFSSIALTLGLSLAATLSSDFTTASLLGLIAIAITTRDLSSRYPFFEARSSNQP